MIILNNFLIRFLNCSIKLFDDVEVFGAVVNDGLDKAVVLCRASSRLWVAVCNVDFGADKFLRAYQLMHFWEVFDPVFLLFEV